MTDFRTPRNTTSAMQAPAEKLLFLAESMSSRGPSAAIEAQEAAGQREIVHSDVIPTDVQATDEELTALGFTLGPVVEGDRMFRRATLPDGWTREGSDHAMWSYLLDGLGRRRASIFYKAAFYDRSAHMSITSVSGYVNSCFYDDTDVIFDDTWATRDAVLAAIDESRAADAERIETWKRYGDENYVREYTDRVSKWDVFKSRIEASHE